MCVGEWVRAGQKGLQMQGGGFGRAERAGQKGLQMQGGGSGGTEGAADAGRGFGRDRRGCKCRAGVRAGQKGLQMQGGGLGASGARCAGKRCGGGAGDCEILWRDETEGPGNLGRISAEMWEIVGAVVRKCGK